ncbi:MAG: acyl-CoA reductase [Novosphingobium sp.]
MTRTGPLIASQNFPDPHTLDVWIPKQGDTGRNSFACAFAPRLIHVLPGNFPGVASKSVAQGAWSRRSPVQDVDRFRERLHYHIACRA